MINDVRKKSTDEDLVKRLKRLVRNWQRLIGVNEATEKELSCESIQDKLISRSTQTFGTFVHSYIHQKNERSSGKCTNYLRRSKIPIRAINPYSSSLISTKQTNASMNVRTSLSNQPPQDHQDVRYLQQSKIHQSAFASQKNLVTGEPPLSTSAASHLPSNSSVQDTKKEQLSDFMNNHTNILKNTSKKVNLFSSVEVSNEGREETNSSEPSQRKTIKPDLMFQNSLNTESMAENSLKQGDDDVKECRKANVFIPDFCLTELPGISRDLTENDLYRLHHDQWHGVNGCYDDKNKWYDWTQSITLDSYRSPLKISPYVCIDYRL